MVFPPYRKPADRNLGPGQAGSRREPQVDLAELSEQVHPERLGASREAYADSSSAPARGLAPDAPRAPQAPRAPHTPHPPHAGDAPRAADAEASAGDDEDIPTLTQVVQASSDDAGATAPAQVHGGAGHEEILQRLLRRSDALLDAQLQQALAPVVEHAAGIVARELRGSIEGIVREVMERALREELARLQAETTETSLLPRRS